MIRLPLNIFHGTTKGYSIMVFKKNRSNDDVLFVDATKCFKKGDKINYIDKASVEKIIGVYENWYTEEDFSQIVDRKLIIKNNYNLFVSAYVKSIKLPPKISLEESINQLSTLKIDNENIDKKIKNCFKNFNVKYFGGDNISILMKLKMAFIINVFNNGKTKYLMSKSPWKKYKLDEILKERGETSTGNEEIYSVSVHKGLVNQIEHLGESKAGKSTSNYNLVKLNDVIYTKSPTGGFPYGIIKQSSVVNDVIVSPLYAVYKPININLAYLLCQFFSYPYNAYNYLHPIVKKGAKNTMNISNDTFISSKVFFPTDPSEINEITNILKLINKKINLLKNVPNGA